MHWGVKKHTHCSRKLGLSRRKTFNVKVKMDFCSEKQFRKKREEGF